MIESVIETKHWRTEDPTSGTISGTAGSPNIVGVGTVFTTDVAVNDILVCEDSAGRRATIQVMTITDNLNIVAYDNLVNAITAGTSFTIIKTVDQTLPWFRADNSVNRSPVFNVTNTFSPLGTQSQVSFMSEVNRNEGVFVKSVYIRMPFQYTLADSFFLLRFGYLNTSGVFIGFITELGELAFFQIPGENIEIPVNTFVPTPLTSGTSRWQIGVQVENSLQPDDKSYSANDFDKAAVSQVNGPDSLNGQFLPIYIGLRILHAAVDLQ